jgi:hypothetical protein
MRTNVTLPLRTTAMVRLVAKKRHRSKPPSRGTRWYAYAGLIVLAAGTIALSVAAIASMP